MTYEHQRKCRMQDAIDDYLNDEEIDARRAYEDMLACVDDVINYHKKMHDRAMANSNPSSSETEISSELLEEWESYLDCCYSLGVEPNKRRFLRYNELYPYK